MSEQAKRETVLDAFYAMAEVLGDDAVVDEVHTAIVCRTPALWMSHYCRELDHIGEVYGEALKASCTGEEPSKGPLKGFSVIRFNA